MKTKKQIEHFLANRKYKSEIDFDGILCYCRDKLKCKFKLHRPTRYYPEPTEDITPLDYATFAKWLDSGFGAGDVVEWGENIGLVQGGDGKSLKICLKIDRNGPNFNPFMLDVECTHKAPEGSVERIYETLRENNKEFGNPFFDVTKKYTPIPNEIVAFHNHKTGEDGVGVVRVVEKSGRVMMYCLYIKNQAVRYSMNEELGVVGDFSFQSVSAADYSRKLLNTSLAKVGKIWNHHLKRIEPLNMKVEKGEKYYFINAAKRTVECEFEMGKLTSHKKYLAGNYFRNQKDAMRILEAENELRRKFLAEPESGEVD